MGVTMAKDIQEIRESQFVLMYGPGALIESKNGTRLIPEINSCLNTKYVQDFLENHEFDKEVRLSSVIRNLTNEEKIHLFSMPSNLSQNMEKGKGSYKTYVFPAWKICNGKHGDVGSILFNSMKSKNNKCPICQDNPSTNVRFLLACCDGHLDDINWNYAVHGNNKCSPEYYIWEDKGRSFSDITITCKDCGAKKTMDDIYTKVHFDCNGRLPEKQGPYFDESSDIYATFSNDSQFSLNEDCKHKMKIVQKQSASLRIPHTITLLKIPIQDHIANIFEQPGMNLLRTQISNAKDFIELLNVFVDIEKSDYEKLLKYFLKEGYIKLENGNYVNSDDEDIFDELKEFKELIFNAINGVKFIEALDDEFNTLLKDEIYEESMVKKPFVNYDLKWLDNSYPINVCSVSKLKTVTAQLSYHREPWIEPDKQGNMSNKSQSSGHKSENGVWYPAYEGVGEGIFITANQSPFSQLNVDENLIKKWDEVIKDMDTGDRPEIKDPLFVWWHTLSHAIINSLSLSCGYNSTSLKERIYISGKKVGILIYNTSPGEDSGMGGLSETANSFEIVLKNAMDSIVSCSNDPLCFNEKIAKNKVNGAACHNCLLISETSCEHRNTMLDRHFFV